MDRCNYSLSDFLPYATNKSGLPGLPLVDVVNLGLSVCEALFVVHLRVQCLHLDVTPGNILLKRAVTTKRGNCEEPEGETYLHYVQISDFGLARRLPRKIPQETTTKQWKPLVEGVAKGTPGYAPLEQMLGRGRRRSDVYSLGATLTYAATGVNPFPGTSADCIRANLQAGTCYS